MYDGQWPAIVTGVADEAKGVVHLTYFDASGPHAATYVKHDESGAAGSWAAVPEMQRPPVPVAADEAPAVAS